MSKQLDLDTNTFVFYNANPKNIIVGDCSIRTVSKALNISWDESLQQLVDIAMIQKRSPGSREVLNQLLELHGFVKMKQPIKPNNKKYRIYEFLEQLEPEKKYANSRIRWMASYYLYWGE